MSSIFLRDFCGSQLWKLDKC